MWRDVGRYDEIARSGWRGYAAGYAAGYARARVGWRGEAGLRFGQQRWAFAYAYPIADIDQDGDKVPHTHRRPPCKEGPPHVPLTPDSMHA